MNDSFRHKINKWLQSIQIKQNAALNLNHRKQIINSFPEPKNCLERSYYQYLCQNNSLTLIIKLLQNITAVIVFPLLWIVFNTKGCNFIKNADAIYLSDGIGMEIIPQSIKVKYHRMVNCSYSGTKIIGKTERKIMKLCIMRYWYAPFFCLKCLVKIGLYANYIESYRPKAVVVYNEYSFTSSLLTAYCREKNITHINVLHGEKMFNLRDAFVEYDQFYVWEDYYKDLFVAMRAEPSQFIVELPEFLKHENKIDHLYPSEPEYDYTYYMGAEQENMLINLRNILDLLQRSNKKVCIRLHPRFSDNAKVVKIFNDYIIEDPNIPIIDSIKNTQAVISIFSTVLYQAYLLGKLVILDDLTDPKRFAQLKDLGYIMLEKPHHLLSKHIQYTLTAK